MTSVGDTAVPGPATVTGGFVSLNPSDGLFLRAEHLAAIQAYSRELSYAIGIGTGTGVVYGFDVTLDATTPALNVLPGLAISPTGQPLRAATAAVVSLAPADRPPIDDSDGFWVVEVSPASWNFGNESVYGNLCDAPCSANGAPIQPWTVEGVTVSLRADTMPGLAYNEPCKRRSWLASQYFERERRRSDPWLVPGLTPGVVGPLRAHEWTKGSVQPSPSAVPIGVIQLCKGELVLDVWTARRDIGGPPADDAWRSRLAMRPWNVFLAEVLQFQDQLSSLALPAAKVGHHEVVDSLRHGAEIYIEKVGGTAHGRLMPFKELKECYERATAPHVVLPDGGSLSDLGFVELPPAGYVDGVRLGAELRSSLEALFANHKLRICHVRADYVAGAVEQAQHLDRIPIPGPPVDIDILVPDIHADLEGLRTAAYGWVAFVRHREACCETRRIEEEHVDVYCMQGIVNEILKEVTEDPMVPPKGATKVGIMSYPPGGWAFPAGESATNVVKVITDAGLTGTKDLAIITTASGPDRVPLAALRGSLFAASLDQGVMPPPVWSLSKPPMPEAIIVVIPQDKTNG